MASGRCVDIPGSNTTPGTQLIIWDCHGGANQTWQFHGGTVRALGACMTAATGTDLTPITISTCTGAATQKWTYEPTTKRLRNDPSGKCLDVNGGATDNNSKIVLYSCHTGTNQQWTLPS
ncbi:RICIN domain-containing protein [Actinoallomurus purpureus]|nr:RICIN domain-containing protein [Actinoallomurus purpureus]